MQRKTNILPKTQQRSHIRAQKHSFFMFSTRISNVAVTALSVICGSSCYICKLLVIFWVKIKRLDECLCTPSCSWVFHFEKKKTAFSYFSDTLSYTLIQTKFLKEPLKTWRGKKTIWSSFEVFNMHITWFGSGRFFQSTRKPSCRLEKALRRWIGRLHGGFSGC